jgi:hypothetical protein
MPPHFNSVQIIIMKLVETIPIFHVPALKNTIMRLHKDSVLITV